MFCRDFIDYFSYESLLKFQRGGEFVELYSTNIFHNNDCDHIVFTLGGNNLS